jgi:hypothetical protein
MGRGMCETVVVAAFGERFEAPARANLCGSVPRWTETWGAGATICLRLSREQVSKGAVVEEVRERAGSMSVSVTGTLPQTTACPDLPCTFHPGTARSA